MHCSDFCSDPMIRRAYPDTAAHMLFWELNALLSGRSLNREALRELKILLCKQGVTGSIPVTSTIYQPANQSFANSDFADTRKLGPFVSNKKLLHSFERSALFR